MITEDSSPPFEPHQEEPLPAPEPESTASAPSAPSTPMEAAPPPTKPARSRYERREQASADALRGLIRDYIAEKYPLLMERGETLPLNLRVDLIPGEPGELYFMPDLRRQLSVQLAETAAPPAAFREGWVFDFQAGTNESPLCRPPSSIAVFAGFDNMGRPKWQEYTQVLLDAKDPEVERLRHKTASLVARVRMGKELKEEQLGSHGRASKDFSLLGQLTAGWFSLPPAFAKIAGDERLAITFQIVETRIKGDFGLKLNTLAGGLLPMELDDLFQESGFRNVAKARARTVDEIASMEGRARAALAAKNTSEFQGVMRGVPKLLNRFKGWLENDKPRTGAQRPPPDPSLWKEDALEAGVDEVFFDAVRSSWLLLGSRGKAHVFTENGRHVTSFALTPDLIEKRIVSERWVGGKEEAKSVLSSIKHAAGTTEPSINP